MQTLRKRTIKREVLHIGTRHRNAPEYLEWLSDIIHLYSEEHADYTSLIKYMYSYRFRYSVVGDENREKDANNILYMRYMDEYGLPYDMETLHDRDTSVLEVLIALSIRCERDIMGEPDEFKDDRWFWIMLENLSLDGCTNDVFDEETVDYILSKWLDRRFAYNGNGGIWPLKFTNRNQKFVEIWYQMQEFLEENYPI